ncbi:MAG: thiosulfate/3-mercaptopyruvate sulfurtransferase [Desulforhopalus sp.]|jgi:thiosulfate/3-mercaptopyruvate sulfurtransferase
MKNVLAVVLILLMSASNGFCFGSSKFKDEVEKEAGAVKLVREVARGGYDIITTAELAELQASGEEILVIDTMPYEASYKKNHVPGAVQFLFPIPDMNEWNNEETAGKSKDEFINLLGDNMEKKIIVYCGFVKCTRSHNGALWAKKLGYKNVYRYPGGIFAWKGAGFEVASVK